MADGMLWEDHGTYLSSDELSDTLRLGLQGTERFRQFCDVDDASSFGLGRGATYNWNIYIDSDSAGTTLDERQRMPESDFSISQGSLTVAEYGRSVPYTGKLDNLSKHPVEKIIKRVLNRHAALTLDSAAHAQFDATLLTVYPTSGNSATAVTFDTDGTPSQTNNLEMSNVHVKLIMDGMKERDIPAYDGQNYCCVARPSTFRAFKDDIEAVHSYVETGFQKILNGEVGRHYEGCRFFEQTVIASEAWTNSKSDAAYFFGSDTVMEAVVVPEEIRAQDNNDYGRSYGIAWYYLGGFGIVRNVSGAAQNTIVKWASAA